MNFTAQDVMKLREQTGAGMMDCKRALGEAEGDFARALRVLQEKNAKLTAKAATREAHEGLVHAYIHPGGRVGVLIEVNCETDFVARNETFRQLCHDLCLQVVAADPKYLSREQVPADAVAAARARLGADVDAGKPAAIREKILGGRLDKWYQEVCLLDQPFVKDEEKTVAALLGELTGKIGERIVIARFARFELGKEF